MLKELQLSLEQEWAEAGYHRYIRDYKNSPFSTTQVGNFLMSKSIADLTAAIQEYRDSLGGPRCFHQRAIFFCLKPVEVATIGLQVMLNHAFRTHKERRGCFSTLCIQIADHLIQLFNWRACQSKAPEYTDYMQRLLKDKGRIFKLRMMKDLKQKLLGGQILSMPTADRLPIGYSIAKIIIESTGFFETYQSHQRHGKSVRTVTEVAMVPQIMQQILNRIEHCAWLRPLYMPMVVPPVPWTSYENCGYLSIPTKIIGHSMGNCRKLWESGHLQPRVDTLNHVQSVAFRIDTDILKYAEEAYRMGHRSVPVSDAGVILPPCPYQSSSERRLLREHSPDVITQYKTELAKIHAQFYNSQTIGKRIGFLRTLSMARKFSQYESIWFPWTMDYRGRYYPLPSGLSPQGDDISKALLVFAKETPFDSKDWHWYKIHGANLMGVDKVPFSERIAFINQHEPEILAAADDPFSTSWWELADKPWRMLQWCLEYAQLKRGQRTTSRLPCDLDGSCNGLQHLSMAIRDSQTGRLVNLCSSDKPMDIYTDVQHMVEQMLPDDSVWKGRVTRKLVKRNVMTTPYSVTKIGMGDQIKDQMMKDAGVGGMLTKAERMSSLELRDFNYEAIQLMLGSSAKLMRWYQEVSTCYMDHGLTMRWDFPDGFRVLQDIQKYYHKEVQLENRTVKLSYRDKTGEQDRRRNRSAVSPNITHSMDAYHMTLWIRHMIANDPDCPIMCVHDSFGLPVHKLTTYGESVLKTFVDLYESFDVIEAIRKDFREQTDGLELPPPPDRGDLDTSAVRGSTYAFA